MKDIRADLQKLRAKIVYPNTLMGELVDLMLKEREAEPPVRLVPGGGWGLVYPPDPDRKSPAMADESWAPQLQASRGGEAIKTLADAAPKSIRWFNMAGKECTAGDFAMEAMETRAKLKRLQAELERRRAVEDQLYWILDQSRKGAVQ